MRTINHEANKNFRAICNCYTTAQIIFFVRFFIVIKKFAEALLCKSARTVCQDLAVRNCFCELSSISFDFTLISVVRKDFNLLCLTSLTGFLCCCCLWLCKCWDWECRENDKNSQQEKRMLKRFPINDNHSICFAAHKATIVTAIPVSKIVWKNEKFLKGGLLEDHFTFLKHLLLWTIFFKDETLQRKAQRSIVRQQRSQEFFSGEASQWRRQSLTLF